jgi:NAD(P)-dependent dehydrogenase (short-subunit alcohol dehydrogenase family)
LIAVQAFDGIDVLVNNAGVSSVKPSKLNEADWDDVLNVNVKGTFFALRLLQSIWLTAVVRSST